MNKTFPENFIFGAATSSYQIEGNNKNSDWYEWEKKKNHIKTECEKACDSWNRFSDDIKLLKEFGLDAYRMSIEWSRIFPKPDQIDTDALKKYEKILLLLKENKIKVFLTLQHHSLPKWLKHGWLNLKIEKHFDNYTTLIGKNFHSLVDAWMPINEPAVNSTFGYFLEEFPPGQRSVLGYIFAARNQVNCHYNSYNKLKEINPNIPVGFIKQLLIFDNLKNNYVDKLLTRYFHYIFNKSYLNAFQKGQIPVSKRYRPEFKKTVDFWGLNYYTRKWVSLRLAGRQQFNVDPNAELTQMGWEWFPEGIRAAAKILWDIKKVPIYITENGIATDNDSKRKKFIYKHLLETLKSLDDGIDIRGYFYWSLLDNFEWCMGYEPKFGLASVEPSTFDRITKDSGYYLGKIAKHKKLIIYK
jgi:beta-glucosidase